MMMFSAHLVQYCVTGDNISGEGRRLDRLSLQQRPPPRRSRGRASLPRRGRRGRERVAVSRGRGLEGVAGFRLFWRFPVSSFSA